MNLIFNNNSKKKILCINVSYIIFLYLKKVILMEIIIYIHELIILIQR